MTTFEELYTFLKKHYRHSRFEARNKWGGDFKDYSICVTNSHFESLKKEGKSFISHHDSLLPQGVIFDTDLNILNKDEAPIDMRKQSGHLSHIF